MTKTHLTPRPTSPPAVKKTKAFAFLQRRSALPATSDTPSTPSISTPSSLFGKGAKVHRTPGGSAEQLVTPRPRKASLLPSEGGEVFLEVEGLPKVRLVPPDDEGRPITLYPLSPLRLSVGQSTYEPPLAPAWSGRHSPTSHLGTPVFEHGTETSSNGRTLSRVTSHRLTSPGSTSLWGSMSGGFATPAPVFSRRGSVAPRHGRPNSATKTPEVVMPRKKQEVAGKRERSDAYTDVRGSVRASSTSTFQGTSTTPPPDLPRGSRRIPSQPASPPLRQAASSFRTPPPNPELDTWPVIDFTQSPQALPPSPTASMNRDHYAKPFSERILAATKSQAPHPATASPQLILNRRTTSHTPSLASRSKQASVNPATNPPLAPVPSTPNPAGTRGRPAELKSQKSLKSLWSFGTAAKSSDLLSMMPRTPVLPKATKTSQPRSTKDNSSTPRLSKRFSLQNLTAGLRRKDRETELARAPPLPVVSDIHRLAKAPRQVVRGSAVYPASVQGEAVEVERSGKPARSAMRSGAAPLMNLAADPPTPAGVRELKTTIVSVDNVEDNQRRWTRYSMLFRDDEYDIHDTTHAVAEPATVALEMPHEESMNVGSPGESSTGSTRTARLAYLEDSTPSHTSTQNIIAGSPATIPSNDSFGSLASFVADSDVQVAVASLVLMSSPIARARAVRRIDPPFKPELATSDSAESLPAPSLPLDAGIGYDLSSALHRADRPTASFSSDTVASLSSSLPSADTDGCPAQTPEPPGPPTMAYQSPRVLSGDDDSEEHDPFSAEFGDEIDVRSLDDGDAVLITSPRQSPQISVVSQSSLGTTTTQSLRTSSQKSGGFRLSGPEGLFRFLPSPHSKRSSHVITSQAQVGKAKRRFTGVVLPQVAAATIEGHMRLESLHFEGLGLHWIEQVPAPAL